MSGVDAVPDRRSDLDVLRVLAIFGLLFFHATRVFDVSEPFYVQNDVRSALLTYGVIGTYGRWSMELLFVISGMASWYALRGRSSRAYLRERLARLGVPFVFGVLVLVPPQAYLATTTYEPYLSFLRRYFTDFSDLSGYHGTFTPAQLWFVLFLLVYAVVALPFFRWWSAPERQAWRDGMARAFTSPLALLSWTAPLALAGALPGVGGKNVVGYLVYFALGYVLAGTPSYQAAIDRDRNKLAVVAVASCAVLTASWMTEGGTERGNLTEVALHFTRTLCAWSSVLTLLGYAHTHLNLRRRGLARANEAAFPVYVVHQTVLVAVAFVVVPLHLNVSVKYLILVTVTFLGSVGTYLIVGRVDALRVLFGLKRRVKVPSTRVQRA
ncbi:acyltransferase family protein [Deinococcus pimensis]|uniref:acyltransferase family protein n=1 Tax=Deinococcus pimensis TaxID=309888 RepID=UPI000485C8F2|nr:acyltransferase [Deinococcus pimensis]